MNKIFSIAFIFAFLYCSSTNAKTQEPAATKDTQESGKITPIANSGPGLKPAGRGSELTYLDPSGQEVKFDEVGNASWYGVQFQNKLTASGEPFDRFKLTAAHRTFPFGSVVKVRNLENNQEATVTINDRGPYNKSRVIDVTEKAAEILNFKDIGLAKVGLTLLKSGDVEVAKNTKDKDSGTKPVGDDDEEEDDEDDDEVDDTPPSKQDSSKKSGTVTPSKTTPEKQPAKQTEKPPAKQSEKQPAKQSEKQPAKQSEEKPSEGKSTSPIKTKPSEAVSDSQPKGFTIQLGVFKDPKRAERLKETLKSGFSEPVFLFPRAGSIVVQIGDFANRTDALNFQEKLKAKGVTGFIPPK